MWSFIKNLFLKILNMSKFLKFEDVLQALRSEGKCSGQVKPDEYHAMKPQLEEALGVPVISKSTLSEFSRGSYRFKWNLDNNIRQTSAALALGSLVDTLTLTPELFPQLYSVEEPRVQLKKDGTPYSDGRQDPAQKEEWQAKAEMGISVISPADQQKGADIAAVATATMISHGLAVGETCETQVGMWVFIDNLHGEPLACPMVVTGMLDLLPTRNSELLWDLKTTSEDICDAGRISRNAETFHYGMQAALYSDLWRICSGEEHAREFGFLFVGTKEPYMARALFMGADVLELYREEYSQLMSEYAIASKLNYWGEAEQEPIHFAPSSYEYRRIGRRAGTNA